MSNPDPKADDFYKVLGVDRNASEADIAKAYKKSALKYHPDKNPDNKEQAEEDFKRITEAYEVLHDKDKRRQYDQFGKAGLNGGGGMGGGGVSYEKATQIFQAFFGAEGGADPFSMFFQEGDNGAFRGMGGMPMAFGNMRGGDIHFGPMGGMGGSHPSVARSPPHAMPNGTSVAIRNLSQNQALNGKTGQIAAWDQARKRYNVQIDGETVALRPANLTQAVSAEITGIESRPALNGKSGDIIGYDDSTSRYTVKFPPPDKPVGISPGNVILPVDTRVLVQGLQSKAELNGQMAKITDFDRSAMRYTVVCEGGQTVKIKLDNVIA